MHPRPNPESISEHFLPFFANPLAEVRVVVLRVESVAKEHDDPALKPFLAWLAKDMMQRPQRIAPFPASLLEKARSLMEGIEVDLDGPLNGGD